MCSQVIEGVFGCTTELQIYAQDKNFIQLKKKKNSKNLFRKNICL